MAKLKQVIDMKAGIDFKLITDLKADKRP